MRWLEESNQYDYCIGSTSGRCLGPGGHQLHALNCVIWTRSGPYKVATDHSLPPSQTPDEEAGLAAIVEAFNKGINFYDTAPFYGGGSAERVSVKPFCSVLLKSVR